MRNLGKDERNRIYYVNVLLILLVITYGIYRTYNSVIRNEMPAYESAGTANDYFFSFIHKHF